MVSSNLKKQFEAMVLKGITPLGELGITPNMITTLGVIVSITAAWIISIYNGDSINLIQAGTLILLSGFLML
jgi:hypothetical protein